MLTLLGKATYTILFNKTLCRFLVDKKCNCFTLVLDVKEEVHDVTVLYDIFFALCGEAAGTAHGRI